MSKLARQIVAEDELQAKISKGIEKALQVAVVAYGPKAGNALIEQPYGDPLLSRDGVTNIRKLYLEDPVENMAVRAVVQAADQCNKITGDGTSAVTILTAHLYQEALKRVAGGHNRMEVARLLEETSYKVLKHIDQLSVPIIKSANQVDEQTLAKIARISSGSNAIGDMISDNIKAIGADNAMPVESFSGNGIFSEIVDGFYFKKGFTALALTNNPSNLESRHVDVPIFLSAKRLLTTSDIAPVLDKIVQAGITEVVIIGEVGPEALDVLAINHMKGIFNGIPVDVPVHDAARALFLDDLALTVGGRVYRQGSNPTDFTVDMLGYAKKVYITGSTTAIIGADGSKEDVEMRVTDLKDQLLTTNDATDMEALRERIGRLTGKAAVVHVGGATEIEQEETKLRVEDAICACQSAVKGGIVPGGGVTLATAPIEHFKTAFEAPFKHLTTNAGLNAERLLGKVQSAKKWKGYNLRSMTDNPVDMLKSGVVDPSLVIKEVVRNAVSVSSRLITSSVGLTFVDREVKND
jgi:chaperonin GroEL